MRQPVRVADYLDTLTRELSFDQPLAHRVRQEVEDHLWEAAAASGDGSSEAQARVIRNFGDAREIASQYAALSLTRQTRRSGALVVVAAGVLYLAMKGRIAWYGLMQWVLSANLQGLAKIVFVVDCSAYIAAFLLGAAGWAYISAGRASARFAAPCRSPSPRRVRCSFRRRPIPSRRRSGFSTSGRLSPSPPSPC